MAFSMIYTDPQGVVHPASYWRIERIDTDFIVGEARVYFAGYPTEALRRAGNSPFQGRQLYRLSVTPATLPEDGVGRAKVYVQVKASDPFFATAQTV